MGAIECKWAAYGWVDFGESYELAFGRGSSRQEHREAAHRAAGNHIPASFAQTANAPLAGGPEMPEVVGMQPGQGEGRLSGASRCPGRSADCPPNKEVSAMHEQRMQPEQPRGSGLPPHREQPEHHFTTC